MLPRKTLNMFTVAEVNSLSHEDFIDTFGNVVEKCPLIAAVVWERRPFRSVQEMQTVFEKTIDEITIDGSARLLRLNSPLCRAEKLSAESVQERTSAGINKIVTDEHKLLSELNTRYQSQFGFPFVLCLRENTKEKMFKSLQKRLKNSVEIEEKNGLNEMKKVSSLRLRDLVRDNTLSKL